jgi:RNA polymerase sigma-70 factor (ECF subfamily)
VFWLRTVVLNQARMLGRSTRIRERLTGSFSNEHHVEVDGPEEWVATRQRRAALDAGLARLSDKLREVVVLRYVTGHSLDEIAEVLDVPVGTVKSRLFAGMAALKEHLGESP